MTGGAHEQGVRARRVRWVVAGVVLVVVAAVLTAWGPVATAQRGDVEVRWSGPLQCAGMTLGTVDDPVPLEPMLHCRLAVTVSNQGWLPVTLDELSVPIMGPAGGAAVRAVRLDGTRPRRAGDPVDAIFPLDRTLGSDRSVSSWSSSGIEPAAARARA